ncbi:MAG: PAS domain-containing protein, partial [Chitinophagaceae bacterium]|nr:PAS domain-containing protein [Chitinophagaceae bacterium]
ALDKNWCYTYMNKKAGELTGRDPDKMIGKNIWTELPESAGQPFQKAYERAMAEQKYTYFEEYFPPFDQWFENHVYPSPEGLSVFFRDITKKKRQKPS